MSIKTKMQINLNFFLVVSSYMIVEWYSNDLAKWIGIDFHINV